MFWAILALKAASAVLALLGRLKKAGIFLATSLVADLVRRPLSWAREGLPRPYVGRGFLLWLPDPALVLLPPSVLLGTAFGWRAGAAVWATSFGYVALSYPALRGDDLLRTYWAVHGAACLAVALKLFWRAVRGKVRMEEALLLLFSLTGIGGIILIRVFGSADWWGVWMVNVAAYASAGFVGILELRSARRKACVQSRDELDDL